MYKLGFLGGGVGSIAGTVHLIASQMDRNFQVLGGIFSHNEEKSKQSAKKYALLHFSSIKEMCDTVDFVVILTPTPNHYENLKELLNYNVKIIVDKPLVANISEFDLNLDNKFVVVTHNYSGYPLVREIKALVADGVLGTIKKIIINMPQESFFKPMKPGYPQEWRLREYEIPTIALDLGVHTYHLARFILGKKFEPFFCRTDSFSNFGVIDDMSVLAKSEDILIELNFSKIMLGNSNPLFIEVYGDNAGIKWSQSDFENLYLTYKNGKKEIFTRSYAHFEANKPRYQRMAPGHPSGFIEAFANIYSDIHTKNIEYISDYQESLDSLNFFKKSLLLQ
ncbi:MAG: oxidoreductase [Arcobacter sp.]|nr:MAG: oxidoreductase [Arcobacter sp.]